MRDPYGYVAYREILSQPALWTAILDLETAGYSPLAGVAARLRSRAEADRSVIFTGCGTTFALGLTAASIFRHYGLWAAAHPASEIAFYPAEYMANAGALIAVSRSGSSSEILWAVDACRRLAPDALVLALTTQPESVLAKMADGCLDASAAQENTIVETRSFTGMLLIAHLLAAVLAGDEACRQRLRVLPSRLEQILPGFVDLAALIAADRQLSRFYFLGTGPMYGIACEAAFKIQEFAAGSAEAYHSLEVRHGPRAAVDSHSLIVGLISDLRADEEIAVLRDLQAQGARTLMIADEAVAQNPGGVDHVMGLQSGLSEWERAALHMPLLQLIACLRAIEDGLDPDHPRNIKAVTRL